MGALARMIALFRTQDVCCTTTPSWQGNPLRVPVASLRQLALPGQRLSAKALATAEAHSSAIQPLSPLDHEQGRRPLSHCTPSTKELIKPLGTPTRNGDFALPPWTSHRLRGILHPQDPRPCVCRPDLHHGFSHGDDQRYADWMRITVSTLNPNEGLSRPLRPLTTVRPPHHQISEAMRTCQASSTWQAP